MAVTLPGTEGGADAVSMIAPPVPFAVIETPALEEAATPLSKIGIALLDGLDASWNVATATGPSGITFVFSPSTIQVLIVQITVFWAFVADDPVLTVTPVISDE